MITGNNYVEAPLEFRKQDIHETLQELLDDLKPIEFESYQDYFLINTFKKGISESGKVDIERLRSGGHAVYYQRVKRKRKSKGSSKEDEEISNPSRSSSKARSASDNNGSSSEEEDDDDSDYGNDNNRNKKKSGSNIDPNTNISESGSADSNFFNGNISKSSIIPAPVKVMLLLFGPFTFPDSCNTAFKTAQDMPYTLVSHYFIYFNRVKSRFSSHLLFWLIS